MTLCLAFAVFVCHTTHGFLAEFCSVIVDQTMYLNSWPTHTNTRAHSNLVSFLPLKVLCILKSVLVGLCQTVPEREGQQGVRRLESMGIKHLNLSKKVQRIICMASIYKGIIVKTAAVALYHGPPSALRVRPAHMECTQPPPSQDYFATVRPHIQSWVLRNS